MLWIPISIGAASLQVARNAAQRGLLGTAGPWGATLVRFLFGLPLSVAFAAVAIWLTAGAHPVFGWACAAACVIGGGAQILATAAMLVSMRRSSFALGTVFQQSGIPLAALFGAVMGDHLSALRWAGLGLTAAALGALGWPRGRAEDWRAAPLGMAAGAGFAVAANAYRQSALMLDPSHPVVGALITLAVVQSLQTVVLTAWLVVTDRGALAAVARSWRMSLSAGVFGAAASGLWFIAFALSPAGPVRAVGVIEAPLAALTGRRLFAERLGAWRWALTILAAFGVGLAALG